MTTLIKIGNSLGVRIPKAYIEKTKLKDKELSFEVLEEGLLIKPINNDKRSSWEAKINSILEKNQNKQEVSNEFLEFDLDIEEWK